MLRALPGAIAVRSDEALRALFHHPERALLPWYRYALYAALDEHGAGWRARAWLDVFAARKALFCWQPLTASPRHRVRSAPDAVLALAAATIHGGADRAAARATLDHALAYCDVAGEPPASPDYAAWCAYEAAARALESACIAAGLAQPPARTLDDAAGYAAVAIGGVGAPGAPQTEQAAEEARLRRAVFWEWWLRDALPEAAARAGA